MAACSEVIVIELTIIIKLQFDQLHLFTIVNFDNWCISYISFALQFPHEKLLPSVLTNFHVLRKIFVRS